MVKNIWRNRNGEGLYCQQTIDAGYIIGGFTTSSGAGGNDALLIKTDASGNSYGHRLMEGH